MLHLKQWQPKSKDFFEDKLEAMCGARGKDWDRLQGRGQTGDARGSQS